ncbi:putative filamentation protein [Thozetella sp. PMI_491]|nr:putative filamentation protein [Thozetella sp. PMI_491]
MPDANKAAHYIQLLHDARCEDNWGEVPELVRKIRKHAPGRACLALTAETEYAITKANQSVAASDQASADASPKVDLEVPDQISKLIGAIENEQQFPEEKFQAQVCIGWLHWVIKEYGLSLVRLPKHFDLEYPQFEDYSTISEWTKVCALKSTYLKANCLARNKQRTEALDAFDSSMPSLAGVWASKPARQQLCYWSELFLTEYCMLAGQALLADQKSLTDANCLACFRAWLKYWASSKGVLLAGGYGFRGSVPRRQVWFEYYYALSRILQEDLPFPTGYAPINNESSARSQLRAELKKVETIYQGLLFSETKFPKAEEERKEVEDFVDLVMRNWAVLIGRGWREHDLGQGGRDALSRAVLDILFAAATKTFHSTAIIRHLFTVHLAVAEFDLAFKSFDSYLDLVKKAKSRVEKTGDPEPSLDNDATVLETISACIAALCRYGDRQAAEKARDLGHELEQWLAKVEQQKSGLDDGISPLKEDVPLPPAQDKVPAHILALSYQSIGLAQAQWARMTYDSESRTLIQEKATQALRKSLSAEFGRAVDVKGVFALGLLLAEQRKLPVAIELVKSALLAPKPSDSSEELYTGPYWRERALIPLWHLLALMLSARQEYFMAARACEGAIEQFKDPFVLFGSRALNGAYRSEHLNETEGRDEKPSDGLIDDMEDYERESILEIKMTQLAILEVVEGPAVAVNASSELLTLFPRLFGDVEQKLELAPSTARAEPPKSSAGTLKSFRGSVFGGKSDKSASKARRQSVATTIAENPPTTASSRPQTMQTISTVAPSIQVTGEPGDVRSARRAKKSDSLKRRSESSRRASLRKRDSSVDRTRVLSTGDLPLSPTVVDGEKFFTPFDDSSMAQYFTFASRSTSAQQTPTAGSFKHSDSYTSTASAKGKASDLAGVTVSAVEPLAALLPLIQFPDGHQQRGRKAILVKVWLTIAGFYRRADLLDNAQKAIAEAQKIVQGLESEVAKDTTGAMSLKKVGWGETKSVEELLSDVWAEKGYLSLAREDPYQARSDFESALTHFPDHPSATVGLSNILMDIYSEKLPLPPAIPGLHPAGLPGILDSVSVINLATKVTVRTKPDPPPTLAARPLGFGLPLGTPKPTKAEPKPKRRTPSPGKDEDQLPPPHKATSLPLVDRLSARDRAYGLLSALTKLGSGWNYSEAWFALARAYQVSGQPDRAKEVLWWCVELEDSMGVREWSCVGAGGYAL